MKSAAEALRRYAQRTKARNQSRYRALLACMQKCTSVYASAYFNADCVQVPTDASQPFGNAKRNAARGDSIFQLDVALSKSFQVKNDARLELRFEAFNVLNKTNFRAANGNRSAAGFGTITATYDPRQLQLGVKLVF